MGKQQNNPAVNNESVSSVLRNAMQQAKETNAQDASKQETQGTILPATTDKYTQGISAFDIRNNNVRQFQADSQSTGSKVLNRALRFIPNVAMGIGEQAGYLLDAENYMGAVGAVETDFNNWFSSAMKKGEEALGEMAPVMTETDSPTNFSDPGTWINHGFDLAESITEFFVTGGVIGKGLGAVGKLAANSQRVRQLAGAITEGKTGAAYAKAAQRGIALENAAQTGAQAATSTLLGYTSGVMSGVDVYEKTKKEMLGAVNPNTGMNYTEEDANSTAAEAAAKTVQLTTLFTSGLNMTSLNPFFRKNTSSTAFAELEKGAIKKAASAGLKDGAKASNDDILGYLKGLRANPVRTQKAASVWKKMTAPEGLLFEMGQEAVEEGAENVAQQMGEGVGKEAMGQDGSVDWFNEDMILSMALGAVGGGMGKGVMSMIDRSSMGETQSANDQRSFERQLDIRIKALEENKAALKEHKEAVAKGDTLAIQMAKDKLFNQNKFNAIQSGTSDYLRATYVDVMNMDEAAAKEQGFEINKDAADYYKKLAKESIDDLASAEEVYESVLIDKNIPEPLKAEAINNMYSLASLDRVSARYTEGIDKGYAKHEAKIGKEPQAMAIKKLSNRIVALELLKNELSSRKPVNQSYLDATTKQLEDAKKEHETLLSDPATTGTIRLASVFSLDNDHLIISNERMLAYNNIMRGEVSKAVADLQSPSKQAKRIAELEEEAAYSVRKGEIVKSFDADEAELKRTSHTVEKMNTITQEMETTTTPFGVADKELVLQRMEDKFAELKGADKEAMTPRMEAARKDLQVAKEAIVNINKQKEQKEKDKIAVKKRAEVEGMGVLSQELRDITIEQFENITPKQLLSPGNVIPAIYNNKRGSISAVEGELLFISAGISEIVSGFGTEQTLSELGISIPKDMVYNVDIEPSGSYFTVSIDGIKYSVNETNVLDAMTFDEAGMLTSLTVNLASGKPVIFTNKLLINDIAQFLLLYNHLFTEFAKDIDNRIVTVDKVSYEVISYNPLNPDKSIIHNNDDKPINSRTTKEKVVDVLRERFVEQVLDPLFNADQVSENAQPSTELRVEEGLSGINSGAKSAVTSTESEGKSGISVATKPVVESELARLSPEERGKVIERGAEDNLFNSVAEPSFEERAIIAIAPEPTFEGHVVIPAEPSPEHSFVEPTAKDATQGTVEGFLAALSGSPEVQKTVGDVRDDARFSVMLENSNGELAETDDYSYAFLKMDPKTNEFVPIRTKEFMLNDNHTVQGADYATAVGKVRKTSSGKWEVERKLLPEGKGSLEAYMEKNKPKAAPIPVQPRLEQQQATTETVVTAGKTILTSNYAKVIDNEIVLLNPEEDLNIQELSNPNFYKGSEVTFELGSNNWWEKNKPEESERWKEAPIYVVHNGKRVTKIQGFKASSDQGRKSLYDALSNGQVVKATVAEKYSSNVINLKDKNGKPLRRPLSSLSEQWVREGDRFVLKRVPVLFTVSKGINPDDYAPGASTLRSLNTSLLPQEVGTQVEDTNVAFDGAVMAVVPGPRGTYIPYQTSTANLSDAARTRLFELLQQLGENPNDLTLFPKINSIVNANVSTDRAIVNERFMQLRKHKDDWFLRFNHEGQLVSIDLKDFAGGLRGEPVTLVKASLEKNAAGEYTIVSQKVEQNYSDGPEIAKGKPVADRIEGVDIREAFNNFLKNKKYQIDSTRIMSNSKFTSPVTGTVYNSYYDYITSTEEGTGDSASIVTTDVYNKNGVNHFNIGLKLKDVTITNQKQRSNLAPARAIQFEQAQEDNLFDGVEGTPIATPLIDVTGDEDSATEDVDFGDAFSFNGGLVSDYGTAIDKPFVDAWLKKRGIQRKYFDEAVELHESFSGVGTGKLHGAVLVDGLVGLWNGTSNGTAFHEAFHHFLNYRTSTTGEKKLLIEAKERYKGDFLRDDIERYKPYFKAQGYSFIGKFIFKDGAQIQLSDLMQDQKTLDIVAEEKLANEFANYVISQQMPRSFPESLAKFFRDLYNYLKSYISNKRTIDQVFSLLESGMLGKKQLYSAASPDIKLSVMPGVTGDVQQQLVEAINSFVIDAIDSGERDAKKAYSKVKDAMLVAGYLKGGKLVTIEEAKHLYETYTLNKKPIPRNSGFAYNGNKAKYVLPVYKNWDAQYSDDNIKNLEAPGWERLAKTHLKSFGVKVFASEDEVIDEQIGDEKVYGKESFEESRKDTISGEVKKFLSRIQSEKLNVLGKNSFVPFDEVFSDVAIAVVGAKSMPEMIARLVDASKTKSHLKSVVDKLRAKDSRFHADFFKNLSMTYIDFVGAEEKVDWVPTGEKNGEIIYKPVVSIRYFDSNNNRASKKILKRWRKNSKTPLNTGLRVKRNGTYVVNPKKDVNGKTVTERLQDSYEFFQTVKANDILTDSNGLTAQGERAIAHFHSFTSDLGMDLTKEAITSYFLNGDIVNRNLIQGTPLFRHITSNTVGVSLSAMLRNIADNKDPYETDSTLMKRFVTIQQKFETEVNGSFISGAGKSVHPFNLATTLSDMIDSYKNGDGVKMLLNDPYFVPTGDVRDEHTSLFVSEMNNPLSKFLNVLKLEDLDVYKTKDEKGDSNNTYKEINYTKSLLLRMNAFLNNASETEMKIALPTLSDRGRMMFLTVPRITNEQGAGKNQYGKSVQETLFSYVVQDIARAKRAMAEWRKAKETGDTSNMIAHYHYDPKKGVMTDKPTGKAMKFTQLPFLNENDAAQKLMRAALIAGDDWYTTTLAEKAEMVGEVRSLISNYVYEEAERLMNKMKELKIHEHNTKNDTYENALDPQGLARYKGGMFDFALDYVTANVIAKNEIIKLTGVDLAYYKSYEDFSKRFGGLATPGYRTHEARHNSKEAVDKHYGDQETYTTAFINDVKNRTNYVQSLVDAGIVDKKFAATYDKGKANKTDAMGFTTLHKHRSKLMGQGTWTDSHEQAYKNYYAAPIGSRRFVDNAGNFPLLTPIKTYHDGLYTPSEQNGRVVRIMVKHSTFPLLEEFTKNSEGFKRLRERMEGEGEFAGMERLDSVNMDSTAKVGMYGNIDFFGADGNLADLKTLVPITLRTANERIPQVIPEHQSKQPLWGSQVRKLIIANIKPDTIYNLKNGTSLSGKQLLDKYHEATGEMIDRSLAKLHRELGYDKYKSNPTKENKLTFLKNVRTLLANSVEERELPENYQKVLRIAEEQGTYDFETPLALPVYQRKFEQIMFSLYKNNVMNQRMNGASMVQIAELAGSTKNGDLKFVRFEDGAIQHAEVAIPFKLAKEMGLYKKEYMTNGEVDTSKIPSDLLTMIGYRIPTQGKNSTLPLKIVRILPLSMSKAIEVPGEITLQMGSDFDIDKLFLMMPNSETEYVNGDTVHVPTVYYQQKLAEFENGKHSFSRQEIAQMMDDPTIVDSFTKIERGDVEPLVAFVRGIKEEHGKLIKNMTPKVRKTYYDVNNLHNTTDEGIQNLIMDISEAILRNPVHAREMLSTVDSDTIGDLADEMKEAYKIGQQLDPNSVLTEIELEMRNKVGGAGIGIYATQLTGHAIGQYTNLRLAPHYGLMIDGETFTEVNGTEDKLGNMMDYGISERLGSSVDNAKDPKMTFISDNAFTSPVIGLFLRTGVTGKDKTGKEIPANYVVSYFINQPIIRELVSIYEQEEAMPNELYGIVNKLGKKYDKTFDISKWDITEMKVSALHNGLGKDTKSNVNAQLRALANFYHYHRAGRMLAKTNKIFNADRISDMSSLAAVESFVAIRDAVLRNDIVLGAEGIIEGEDYTTTKHFLKVIEQSATFAEEFFPFNKRGLSEVKRELTTALNKDNLTDEIIDAVNRNAFLWMFNKPDSPFAGTFTAQRVKELFYSDDSIDRKLESFKQREDLKDNKFLMRIMPSEDSMQDVVDIPSLSFDYSYTMSQYEHSQLTDEFLALARHTDKDVRDFAKDLVDYTILSKGFSPGVNSFADIIPIEYWTSPEFYAGGETMAAYFKRKYNDFDSPSKFTGFKDRFIQNNSHIKGLVPAVKEKIPAGKMLPAKAPQFNYEASGNDNYGFAEYLRHADRRTKEVTLYKLLDANPNGARYEAIPARGIPYKLVDYSENGLLKKLNPEVKKTVKDATVKKYQKVCFTANI